MMRVKAEKGLKNEGYEKVTMKTTPFHILRSCSRMRVMRK